MRSEAELNAAMEQYADTVKRICLYRLHCREDTEDVFQEVFLKYYLSQEAFSSPEHENAWLIRVTINACKDHLKYLFRHRTVPLETLAQESLPAESESGQVLSALLSLQKKYRDVLYLHYYEGYSAREIGRILGKKENTVYSLLSRGRQQMQDILGGNHSDSPTENRV